MNKYLLKELRDSAKSEDDKYFLEIYKYELDRFCYANPEYVNSFLVPRYMDLGVDKNQSDKFKRKIGYLLNPKILSNYLTNKLKKYTPQVKTKEPLNEEVTLPETINILNGISSLGTKYLNKYNFKVYDNSFLLLHNPDYSILNDNIVNLKRRVQLRLNNDSFIDFVDDEELKQLTKQVEEDIKKDIDNFNLKAYFTFTGEFFQSKIIINAFKSKGVPSFIFEHGLPAIYSKNVDDNSDYLCVWGPKMKENFINIAGFDPDKIIITGCPKYRDINYDVKLRNSLDDILIIPFSAVNLIQHEWDNVSFIDPNLTFVYLYQVKKILEKFGVKKVRYRPHPIMLKDWIVKFLDKDFFELDTLPVDESLEKSTLVIGATSSMLLDSVIHGVNYLIYEPEGFSNRLVPPFDGNDKDFEVAFNDNELYEMIKNKHCINPRAIEGYIEPFDLSKVLPYIK